MQWQGAVLFKYFLGACFGDAKARSAAATGIVTSGIVAIVTMVAALTVVATAAVVADVVVVVGTSIITLFCFGSCNDEAKTRAKRATLLSYEYCFPRK